MKNVLANTVPSEMESKANSRRKGKLTKSLEMQSKPVLDISSEGHLDTMCSYMIDNFNETLQSPKLVGLFHGMQDASDAVEIVDVTSNRDYSHSTAMWDSPVLRQFIHLHRKEFNSQERSVALAEKMSKSMTALLQGKEPLFRTFLMRKMQFRRVPRVFFKPADSSMGLLRRR